MSLAPVAVKKWWEKYVMQINLDTVKGDAGYQALVDARNEVQGSLLIKSVAAIKSQDAFKGRAAPELIKAVDNLARDVEKLNEAGGQEQEHIELDLKPSVPERLLEFYSFQKFHLKVRKLNFKFWFRFCPASKVVPITFESCSLSRVAGRTATPPPSFTRAAAFRRISTPTAPCLRTAR